MVCGTYATIVATRQESELKTANVNRQTVVNWFNRKCLCNFYTAVSLLSSMFYNINNKKKIYNAHIVMHHESEARAVARWTDGVC